MENGNEQTMPTTMQDELETITLREIKVDSESLKNHAPTIYKVKKANMLMNRINSFNLDIEFGCRGNMLNTKPRRALLGNGCNYGLIIDGEIEDTRPSKNHRVSRGVDEVAFELNKASEDETPAIKKIRIAIEKLTKVCLYNDVIDALKNRGEDCNGFLLQVDDSKLERNISNRIKQKLGLNYALGDVKVVMVAHLGYDAKQYLRTKVCENVVDLLDVVYYSSREDLIRNYIEVMTHHLLPYLNIAICISSEYGTINTAFLEKMEISGRDVYTKINMFNDLKRRIICKFRDELFKTLLDVCYSKGDFTDIYNLADRIEEYEQNNKGYGLSFNARRDVLKYLNTFYIRKDAFITYAYDAIKENVYEVGIDGEPKRLESSHPISKAYNLIKLSSKVSRQRELYAHMLKEPNIHGFLDADVYSSTVIAGDIQLAFILVADSTSKNRSITKDDYGVFMLEFHNRVKNNGSHEEIEKHIWNNMEVMFKVLKRAQPHFDKDAYDLGLRLSFIRDIVFQSVPTRTTTYKDIANIEDPVEFMKKLDSIGLGLYGVACNSVFLFLRELDDIAIEIADGYHHASVSVFNDYLTIRSNLDREKERPTKVKLDSGEEVDLRDVKVERGKFCAESIAELMKGYAMFEDYMRLEQNGQWHFKRIEKECSNLKALVTAILKADHLREAFELSDKDEIAKRAFYFQDLEHSIKDSDGIFLEPTKDRVLTYKSRGGTILGIAKNIDKCIDAILTGIDAIDKEYSVEAKFLKDMIEGAKVVADQYLENQYEGDSTNG